MENDKRSKYVEEDSKDLNMKPHTGGEIEICNKENTIETTITNHEQVR